MPDMDDQTGRNKNTNASGEVSPRGTGGVGALLRREGLYSSTRVRKAEEMKRDVVNLLELGRGVELDTSAETFWGLLNAVTEYVDHHTGKVDRDRLVHSLLSDGMAFEMRACSEISKVAKTAKDDTDQPFRHPVGFPLTGGGGMVTVRASK
jgi:hypothetical protein